jgi:hypothetical protein
MFRTLRPDEIECRISEIGKDGSWLTLLLYKTARTDACLLDETVGPYAWANDYRIIDGKMYCGIGIRNDASAEWIWKWNVGTESNTEAEKGEASDALKRAGFVWGIGTELYSAPRIYVRSDACEIKKRNDWKFVCYDRFSVKTISYDASERISALEIVNQKTGRVVFKMGTPKAEQGGERGTTSSALRAPSPQGEGSAPGRQTRMEETGPASPTEAPTMAKTYQCRRCGMEIDEETANASYAESKRILCPECLQAYRDWKAQQGGN